MIKLSPWKTIVPRGKVEKYERFNIRSLSKQIALYCPESNIYCFTFLPSDSPKEMEDEYIKQLKKTISVDWFRACFYDIDCHLRRR